MLSFSSIDHYCRKSCNERKIAVRKVLAPALAWHIKDATPIPHGSQMVKSKPSGALHFVTGNIIDRIPIFKQHRVIGAQSQKLLPLQISWS
jgi:hypothetical protein